MKLLCKLFGHKWDFQVDIYGTITCERCGIELKDYWSKKFHSQDFNRSDLDESENVFPEKWQYKSVKDMAANLGLSETQCSNYLRLKSLEK